MFPNEKTYALLLHKGTTIISKLKNYFSSSEKLTYFAVGSANAVYLHKSSPPCGRNPAGFCIFAGKTENYFKMTGIKNIVFMLALSLLAWECYSQDAAWRENLKFLQYSPRYFGPNAFPVPTLRNGSIGNRIEAEIRGEYHFYEGDRTSDVFTRLLIPVADGRAGLELSWVVHEYYEMTGATVEERHGAGPSWITGATGDIVVSSFYRLPENIRFAAITLEATLKTASGNRLVDARYTDAATYWFDVNIGRSLYESADSKYNVNIQGLIGFYCWMTNDIIHRQNDATVYSGGISGKCRNVTLAVDVAGFFGYENNGDRPIQIRTKLNYEFSRNILSLGYKHGMKDNLYDTCSLAYIRCF